MISCLKNNQVPAKKVPTTGQDATLVGLQNILSDYQCMTVYKPVYTEAQAAAAVAMYLRAGQKPPSSLVNGKTNNKVTNVPSVYLTPVSVNTQNMNVDRGQGQVRVRRRTCAPAPSPPPVPRRGSSPEPLTQQWRPAKRPVHLHLPRSRRGRTSRCSSCARSARASVRCRRCVASTSSLDSGQVTALVGDNGAGKSVLIKTIAGIHGPDGGEILWKGDPVHIRSPKAAAALGIETVYQDLALVRQPRHRPEHVPRSGGARATACWTRRTWSSRPARR